MDSEFAMFEQTVLDFASKELVEGREERDRFPFYPLFEDVLRKARTVGFFSVTMPEELDGAGMGVSALCLLLEGLCRADASLAAVIFTATLAREVIYHSSGAPRLDDLMLKVCGSEGPLLAFPSFTNPAECKGLTAEAAGDGGYSLSGQAEYVVLGGIAGSAVLPVRGRGNGYSFLLVELSGSGIAVSEPVMSLGLHACPAVDLVLDGARGLLIGEEGEGAVCFERVAGMMNAAAAAMSSGVMKGSFEEALAYARERVQGGREIVNWSEVRRILARMAVKLKAVDLAVREVCRSADESEPGWELGAKAAALFAGQAASEVTTAGIQVLGGNGYMEDFGQEKRFRDAEQIRSLLGLVPMRELELMGKVLEGELLY